MRGSRPSWRNKFDTPTLLRCPRCGSGSLTRRSVGSAHGPCWSTLDIRSPTTATILGCWISGAHSSCCTPPWSFTTTSSTRTSSDAATPPYRRTIATQHLHKANHKPPPNISVTQRHCWQETRSEEHTSELQSRGHLVCRLLLEKKNKHA